MQFHLSPQACLGIGALLVGAVIELLAAKWGLGQLELVGKLSYAGVFLLGKEWAPQSTRAQAAIARKSQPAPL